MRNIMRLQGPKQRPASVCQLRRTGRLTKPAGLWQYTATFVQRGPYMYTILGSTYNGCV